MSSSAERARQVLASRRRSTSSAPRAATTSADLSPERRASCWTLAVGSSPRQRFEPGTSLGQALVLPCPAAEVRQISGGQSGVLREDLPNPFAGEAEGPA